MTYEQEPQSIESTTAASRKPNRSLWKAWTFRAAMALCTISAGSIAASVLSEQNQPETEASANTAASRVVPTPGPGAMTVYAVTNPNSIDLITTDIITDTLGFRTEITNTREARSISYSRLSRYQNVPRDFNGAATIEADLPFTAEIVGYDYIAPKLPPTKEDLARWADLFGTGQVTIRSIQFVAGRVGASIGDPLYDESADVANSKGETDWDGRPYPDGGIKISDAQTEASRFGYTYTLTTTVGMAAPASTLNPDRLISRAEAFDGTNLIIEPKETTVKTGENFTVTLRADNLSNLGGFETWLKHDERFELVRALLNTELNATGRLLRTLPEKKREGTIIFGVYSSGATPDGVGGDRILATFVFKALKVGQSNLDVTHAEIVQPLGDEQKIGTLAGSRVRIVPHYGFKVDLSKMYKSSPNP